MSVNYLFKKRKIADISVNCSSLQNMYFVIQSYVLFLLFIVHSVFHRCASLYEQDEANLFAEPSVMSASRVPYLLQLAEKMCQWWQSAWVCAPGRMLQTCWRTLGSAKTSSQVTQRPRATYLPIVSNCSSILGEPRPGLVGSSRGFWFPWWPVGQASIPPVAAGNV